MYFVVASSFVNENNGIYEATERENKKKIVSKAF